MAKKTITSAIALSGLTAALLTLSGCGSSSSSAGAVSSCDAATFDVVLSGDITSNTDLNASLVYGIDGKVRVMSGNTLTIPAGTVVAGCAPTSYLMIKPGAQINAVGTQAAPVTFTSQTDLKGLSTDGAVGEWGGLVILGNAFTDHGVVQYEAGDVDDTFGAVDHAADAESSGTLDYVLVKHTGFEVEIDKELNGLSLGGVGSGTTLSNIAIVGGADDGLEIWGGTVGINGLYVNNAKDDSVDTDLGYQGTIQNVYVVQKLVDKTNNHDSATIETGNDTNVNDPVTGDKTIPTITNFTGEIVGTGIYMKNDAGLNLNNAIFIANKSDVNTTVAGNELVTYRTEDVIATNAMAATTVCFNNLGTMAVNAGDYRYFSDVNSKTSTPATDTAYLDWTTNAQLAGYIVDSTVGCTGATIANIWKGSAGSNNPVEPVVSLLP